MQRKRSWGTVVSLKHAQFLSFSENRNNSRVLRTFSRWELKYNSLHCFLIESAQSLKKRRESWLLKISSCFKGWPPLKRVSLPGVPIGRDLRAGFMLACGQGSAELPFKSLFPEKRHFSIPLGVWLRTGCFLKQGLHLADIMCLKISKAVNFSKSGFFCGVNFLS